MKSIYIFLGFYCAIFLMFGCSDSQNRQKALIAEDSHYAISQIAGNQMRSYADNPKSLMRDIKASKREYRKLANALSGNVAKHWSDEDISLPSNDVYVRYSNNYKSKASIDFERGKVRVESIDKTDRIASLESAIVSALLLPQDPSKVDLYSSDDFVFDGKPFLAGLVKDNEGQDILTQWRAKRYASFLTQNALKTRRDSKGREVSYIEINMVGDYQRKSEQRYESIVKQYAKTYNVPSDLVLAIMQTESNFNPYAVSAAPAYGLMQIVPSTAGADAYELINGKKGIPTKEMLFNPQTNIEYGVAYLSILYNRYLNEIKDNTSQEYCVITAYNAGAGTVLRTFDIDKAKAVEMINKLSPSKVYDTLRNKLSSDEGRRYLLKVTTNKKHYTYIK